jgi:hypothetical protein
MSIVVNTYFPAQLTLNFRSYIVVYSFITMDYKDLGGLFAPLFMRRFHTCRPYPALVHPNL